MRERKGVGKIKMEKGEKKEKIKRVGE